MVLEALGLLLEAWLLRVPLRKRHPCRRGLLVMVPAPRVLPLEGSLPRRALRAAAPPRLQMCPGIPASA